MVSRPWDCGLGLRLVRVCNHRRVLRFSTTSRRFLTNPNTMSNSQRQRAQYWRGGTSNGVLVSGSDLPEWLEIREQHLDGRIDLKDCARLLQPLYRAIMGSPDPYQRQLNGMGGGLSSLSKAVIVDRSTDEDIDLDYLFIQIGIKDGKLDLAGNCGNMTAAVAPFALNEGLIDAEVKAACSTSRSALSTQTQLMTIRLRNLNTNRIIDAEIYAGRLNSSNQICFQERGDYILDGVPGYASPITLSFLSPGGAKTGKALPTGKSLDDLEYSPGKSIRASLLDISNPGVFIDGREVGWRPEFTPEQLNADTELMCRLEMIRRAGATKMGLDPETPSVPKVVLLFPPATDDVHINCQALSMEQAHKAVPMTLGLNLGVACNMPGTMANELARHRNGRRINAVVIGHPSGKVEVGADISAVGEIVSAKVVRTARCLMEGWVNIESSAKVTLG